MKTIRSFFLNKGQGLLEVLFTVAIAALILTGVVSLATKGVSNETFSKNNALATKYAQEASEWIRGERDANWVNFDNRTPGIYNLGTIGTWGSDNPISGTSLNRTVVLEYDPDFAVTANDTILATVRVFWADGQGTHEVTSVTRYTNWNN